ncbi:GNAT family N-acetyltransferase [Nocardia sp. NPDC052566]|uniref:GNAT family N-acetyltransferase n=1 Tax=Nocardia sp. NPDC052566 TaxID=3364330 RepID=UPI0037CC5C79
MDDIRIRPMVAADMAAACEVLGLAFADNPNTLALAGGDRVKAERIMRSGVRVGKLGRKFTQVFVAERAGAVVAVFNAAQWPRCQLSAAEKLRTAPRMLGLLGTALPRAATAIRVMAKHDPAQPHWHLGPIGVHPDHQGRGIAKTMLTMFLGTADEQRIPAYLETDVERNVRLYQSFGFEVVDRADINGVDNRFMWRAA